MEKFKIEENDKRDRQIGPIFISEGCHEAMKLISKMNKIPLAHVARQMIMFAFRNLDEELKAELKRIAKPELK